MPRWRVHLGIEPPEIVPDRFHCADFFRNRHLIKREDSFHGSTLSQILKTFQKES